MKTLDVGSVLAQGQQVINGYKSASVDLGELLGVARTADANVVGAIQEQGAAAIEEERAKQERVAAQDAELRQVRQQAGVLGPAGKHAQMTMDVAAMDADLRPKRAELLQKMSITIADNPLQWLANQFTLPQEVARYNALWEGRQGLNEALQTDIQTSTAAANFARSTFEASSTAEGAAALKKISAATNVAAAQASVEAAKNSITMLVNKAQFDRLPFETAASMLRLKMDAENNALSKIRFQWEKENKDRDMRLYELRLKAGELEYSKAVKNVADEESFVQRLGLAAATLNLDPMNMVEFEAMQRSNPTMANALLTVAGQIDPKVPYSEQTWTLGANLADTLKFVNRTGVQLGGGKGELLNLAERFIGQQAVKYDKANPGQKFKALSKEQQESLITGWATSFEQSFADPNAPGSLFNTMSVAGLMGTKEGSLNLGQNPVVQLLAKKYEATPGQQVTAEEIVGTAAGMLNRAKSAAEVEAVAKHVANIFEARKVQAYNMYEPQRVGMQMPSKIDYVFDPGFLRGESVTADLGNASEVKNLLLRAAATNRLNERVKQGTPLGVGNAINAEVMGVGSAVGEAVQSIPARGSFFRN